jgi:hypothetical protein
MLKFLALAVLALVTSSSALAATKSCQTVSGTFVSHSVPCAIPAVSCVESRHTGALAGTSNTIVTAFDSPTRHFSGTIRFALSGGLVLRGTIVGQVVSSGVTQSVVAFTGGNRQFEHATGHIANAALNRVGTYAGEVCLANGGPASKTAKTRGNGRRRSL